MKDVHVPRVLLAALLLILLVIPAAYILVLPMQMYMTPEQMTKLVIAIAYYLFLAGAAYIVFQVGEVIRQAE